MRVVGLDLAGSPKNSTGYCLLAVEDDKKTVSTRLLYSDEEIVSLTADSRADVVAVDAPIKYSGSRRGCDEALREYGALPVTLKGMEVLAERGSKLAPRLTEKGLEVIEVFAKGSAKMLGFYAKDDFAMQKSMMALDLSGDMSTKIMSRDEMDAVAAAITGYLYLVGKARAVGEDETVYVPVV